MQGDNYCWKYGDGGNGSSSRETERASKGGCNEEEMVVGQFGRMSMMDCLPTQKKYQQEDSHCYRTPEKYRQ